ncbi:MAG: Nif11-like leader peptide family natural product precursor [Candidatus Eremiobacterota bacterium]
MSLEEAKAYIERMKTDEKFRKKVTECKDAETRSDYVKNAGYEFTVEHLQEVLIEIPEEELTIVSGGDFNPWEFCSFSSNLYL